MTGPAWAAAIAAATAVAVLVPPPPAGPAAPRPPGTAARAVSRTGLGPGLRALVAAAVGFGVLTLVGRGPGEVAGVVGAAVAWQLTGRMEPPAARRRRERLAADLPHVVDLLAASLAVGLAPAGATRRIAAALDGPVAVELTALLARLDFGVDPATAWRDLGRHPELGPLGRCVARSVESGASVADAMSRLADDLRRDAHARVEARARAVGVRAAVPLGVCLLPAFLLVGVVPLVVGSVPLVLGR